MRFRVGLQSIIITSLWSASIGLASTPLEVFNAVSSEGQTTDAVSLAEADLKRSVLGLSASLSVDPGVSYGVKEVDADKSFGDPNFEFDYSVGLGVDYIYDRADILSQRIDLLQAEEALQIARRSVIKDALLSHAELLRAQLSLESAEGTVAEREEEFSNRQADVDTTKGELRAAELELQEARLVLTRARRRLVELETRLEPWGVSTPVTFSPMFFSLPDAILEDDLVYQRLKLALAKAELEAQQSTVFDVVESVELSGGYFGTKVAVSGDLNLKKGKPGVGIDTTLRDNDKQSWKVELKASFGFDDQSLRRFSEANVQVAEAETALEEFVASYVANWEEKRLDVEYALEDLMISLESSQVDLLREDELETIIPTIQSEVEDLSAELETLTERRDAAQGDEKRTLDQQVRSLQTTIRDTNREVQNTQRELSRLQGSRSGVLNSLYRTWIAYIQAVENYLDIVGGEWEPSE